MLLFGVVQHATMEWKTGGDYGWDRGNIEEYTTQNRDVGLPMSFKAQYTSFNLESPS
jgi:hypothetical protein